MGGPAAPHTNYFDCKSLARLVERCGFSVAHQEATFPIDMFLLMGNSYSGNDELGRACHGRRKKLELALSKGGTGNLLGNLYAQLAQVGVGREILMIAQCHA